MENNILLRKLKDSEEDYKLLEKWYQEKEVYTHFEQRILSYDEIKEKYYPRTMEDAKVPVFMIEYENKPVGIIQYQLINEENKKLYQLEEDNCYEIDIFIGELSYHNKGIGSKSILELANYLYKKQNAKHIIMCPLKDNINAIKCYQKCGLNIIRAFTTKDTIGLEQVFVLMMK